MRIGVLAMVLVLGLTACNSPRGPGGSADLARHDRFSEELRDVMLRMQGLVHERELTAAEVRRLRTQQAQRLARVADDLVEATHSLIAKDTGLSATESEAFTALATELSAQAKSIERISRSGDRDALELAFARLTAICNACHEHYRGPE